VYNDDRALSRRLGNQSGYTIQLFARVDQLSTKLQHDRSHVDA